MKRSREPGEEIDYGFDLKGVGRFACRDSTLPTAKLSLLDSDVKNKASDGKTMKCSLPPHVEPLAFNSYQEYESHYTHFHTNRCLECRKNFPSEHLLSVHIEECHDPLVRVRRDKGEHTVSNTFSCFVESCERKCLTHQKRRLHMIDKHMYPRNFFFGVTKDGIDGRCSLLVERTNHRPRSSTTVSISKESRQRVSNVKGKELASKGKDDNSGCQRPLESKAEGVQMEQSVDAEIADLAGTMSALKFVPPSVRFGLGRARFSNS